MDHTYRIILHGKRATDEPLRQAVLKLREEGASIDMRVTWEAGDSVRLAKEAARAGITTVIAAGGDGSINEVATGVLQSQVDPLPAVGVIPMGTANDFARGCQIPRGDPEAALRLIVEGTPRLIDVGQVQDRYFVNLASGGTGTKITVQTPEKMKRLLGGVAYLFTGLRNVDSLAPCEAVFTGPGFTWTGSFYALAVGNGRFAGGGVPLCPAALLDDGLLNVNILPEIPPEQRREVLESVLEKGVLGLEAYVVHAVLPWVHIEAAKGIQINLDGEPLHGTSIRLEIVPRSLRFYVPDDAPLVDPLV